MRRTTVRHGIAGACISPGRGPGPFRPLRGCALGASMAPLRGYGPVPRPGWAMGPNPSCIRALPGGPSSLGFSAGLFPLSASPLAAGPLPLRGAASGGRSRRRCRGPAPALAPCGGPGPRPFPPALPLGLCAPLRGSVPLAGPVCLWRRPWAAAGFLRVAPGALAAASGLRRVQRVAPPGPPLAVPFGASGPAARVPGGGGGLRPPFLSAPPGPFFARVLRPLRFSSGGGFSPAPLPSPPPPLGAPGKRKARLGGPAGPPPSAAPPGAVVWPCAFPL